MAILYPSGLPNIKSIQRGTKNINASQTNNITISGIDTTKSIIRIFYKTSQEARQGSVSAKIINPTTINLYTAVTCNASQVISWEVIEFNNVKSLQTGLFSDGGTVTISNINTSKAILFYSATVNVTTSTDIGYYLIDGHIVSNTQLSFSNPTNTFSADWQVIEFN